MTRLYKWFRAVVMTVVALAIFLPMAVYIVLSSNIAQDRLRSFAISELSELLGTEVTIGRVGIQPFNRVTVNDVTVADDYGRTALTVGEIEARFEFWYFVTTGHMVFDYALLDEVSATLYKKTFDSPLNISGIIRNLKSDKKDDDEKRFNLGVYTVKVVNANATYDILDAEQTSSKFDINHCAVSGLNLIVSAPKLSNEKISGKIRHLSFTDISGFAVRNLTAEMTYTPTSLSLQNFVVELPATRLDFGSFVIEDDKGLNLNELFKSIPLDVRIDKGSYFTLSDFGAFAPFLATVNRRFDIESQVIASEQHIDIAHLNISEVTDGGFFLNFQGGIHNPLMRDSISLSDLRLDVTTYAPSVVDLLKRARININVGTSDMLKRLGKITFNASLSGPLTALVCNSELSSQLGVVLIDGNVRTDSWFSSVNTEGRVEITDFNVGEFVNNSRIGSFSSVIEGKFAMGHDRRPICDLSVSRTKGMYNGQRLKDLDLTFQMAKSGTFSTHLEAYLEKSVAFLTATGSTEKSRPQLAGKLSLAHLSPYDIGFTDKYDGYELDVDVAFDLKDIKADGIDGFVNINDLMFRSRDFSKPRLHINKFHVNANNKIRPNIIEFSSDFFNGSVQGDVNIFNLVSQSRDILSSVIPALIGKSSDTVITNTGKVKAPTKASKMPDTLRDNDFVFNFVIDNTENIVNFFHLPIDIIYPVTIDGAVNAPEGMMWAGIDAPYLMKGDMLVEQTAFEARVDAISGQGDTFLSTHFPTKKGDMTVIAGIHLNNNTLATTIDWEIERLKPINGKLAFDTRFSRDVDNDKLCIEADFRPSSINFGNDTWHLASSSIYFKPGLLNVNKFSLATETQSIKIDGSTSKDDADKEIVIDLKDVVLNTIFETLDIDKALIGGTATGTFHGGGIFTGEPFVTCDNLHVENIGYNYCVLGNGDVKAHWDNESQSFFLDAVISQPDDRLSHIYGNIYPIKESLDLSFEADHVKVGFMKPFMEAFAADISGYASGKARIFGNFKYIDMEGDVYADNLGLKVGFTNTWYYATDSIHIREGIIDINNVTVRDIEGHTALLNGEVKHTFFKDPIFDFRITDAHNLLCYDVTPNLSPDWYGKIFGNGAAFINGSPGTVNIDINMSTAEGSTFTFVLSDTEEAEQYNFITFRNRQPEIITDSIIQKDILPAAVREYQEKRRAMAIAENPPSVYRMDIQMDITPDAKVILIMDPVGGDEIKSWGKGNLRMTYVSAGNELRMYGSYAIDRGSYNFTLQDIIVKDFTIKEGSSITFTGDPYNATLDIAASYGVNANLSDLDESFINDPELNRTNVPVRALLLVKGDMRQPDIDFDLEFPTLTSDVYRKVRSIISTDEMMNRQIIYLLALNRFYTPEYMSATKGNELFSVASSTISSRLSSMLGKLSENWSISPNLRSDKGDFSDVQFDVALSSNLLNNRLRMNGNFGYRDKSLNTTQFIGDFDLEYLLNRAGTWRLKAYNRFNDQTYFLRTAKTTQGVGIMFQRDFDNMFNFLKPKKQTIDSVKTE